MSDSESPEKPKQVLHRYRRRRRWIAIFFTVAHVVGALTSVRAVMDVRTAQGAVAWVISLNTMPVVAVPAYWVFGRTKFQGYVAARRSEREEVQHFREEFERKLVEQNLVALPERQRPLYIEKLAALPFTQGNDVDLLIDGEATFDSILNGIAGAEDYVLVQFYIMRDDGIGQRLKKALLERAAAGVRCFVLYDEIGTRKMEGYMRELREGGVEVLPFNTTQGSANRFQINFRNHRKIVVVDGTEAWVGGLNVGDEYLGLDPKFGDWRDTHLRITGPAVPCVQVAFVEDWHWASDIYIPELNWDPKPAPGDASKSILCLPTGPDDPLESCTLFFLSVIHSAKKRIWIATPYFVPDEQFISALQLAALKGLDVKILIPQKNDNAMVQLSGWSFVQELEEAGVEMHHYTRGFMHHKVMLIDDDFATVGTANFDNRSFRLNFEITMAVLDAGFASEVEAMLQEDFRHSVQVTASDLADRSFWYRFGVRASRLTAPVQ